MSDRKGEQEAAFTDAKPSGTAKDRRMTRYGVEVTVTVNTDHYFLAGEVTNLSAGGVFIATPIVHPVGAEFDLSLHLGDGDRRAVHAVGVVRWHRPATEGSDMPQGLGIQFLSIEDDGAARIERYLAQRTARSREGEV